MKIIAFSRDVCIKKDESAAILFRVTPGGGIRPHPAVNCEDWLKILKIRL